MKLTKATKIVILSTATIGAGVFAGALYNDTRGGTDDNRGSSMTSELKTIKAGDSDNKKELDNTESVDVRGVETLDVTESEPTRQVAVDYVETEPADAPVEVVEPAETSSPANPYIESTPAGYAASKRIQLGKAVGHWGSGWIHSAIAEGLAVNNTPAVGSTASDMNMLYHVEDITDTKIIMTFYANGVHTRVYELDSDHARQLMFIH